MATGYAAPKIMISQVMQIISPSKSDEDVTLNRYPIQWLAERHYAYQQPTKIPQSKQGSSSLRAIDLHGGEELVGNYLKELSCGESLSIR
jgi:hypothetical protein